MHIASISRQTFTAHSVFVEKSLNQAQKNPKELTNHVGTASIEFNRICYLVAITVISASYLSSSTSEEANDHNKAL